MQQTKIKTIVLLPLLGFILGVVAISFHHHDNSFLLPTCSLCKVKTAFSGTSSKIKIDTVPAAADKYFLLTAIILCLSDILSNRKRVFIHSRIAETYPNKAPPLSL